MTNRLAVILGVLIVGSIVMDGLFFGTEHFVFLGRKFMALIEWLAFWR